VKDDERNDSMDNFSVQVTARDPKTFENAFRLAFNPPGGKAKYFVITEVTQENWMFREGVLTMILLWSKDGLAERLPYEMDVDAALSFVSGWLASVKYPEQPDHDGSNVKGFIISTGNFWGHIDSHYSILGVQPCWALLGK